MTEAQTNTPLIEAFREAAECQSGGNCKKLAAAMVMFYEKCNEKTLETGEGKFTFYVSSDEDKPCPNQDQLFCQDRLE